MTKTVFIVGAGASKEVLLPIGEELTSYIRDALKFRVSHDGVHGGNYSIVEAFRQKVTMHSDPSESAYIGAAQWISEAIPLSASIDNFIDNQRGNAAIELAGKLAIVATILEAERRSKLYFSDENVRNTIAFSGLHNTWFLPFFHLLTDGCTEQQLDNRFRSVVFVVFNYDRCIEHFIFNALRTKYKVTPDRAKSLVHLIRIFHPYGAVGTLPWTGSSESISFGGEPRSGQLLSLATGIKTFAEGMEPGLPGIRAMHAAIMDATRFVFLGFAFHPQNMELLWSEHHKIKRDKRNKCFATAFGRSNRDVEVVTAAIAENLGVGAQIELRNDLLCHKLFHEYSRSMSLL